MYYPPFTCEMNLHEQTVHSTSKFKDVLPIIRAAVHRASELKLYSIIIEMGSWDNVLIVRVGNNSFIKHTRAQLSRTARRELAEEIAVMFLNDLSVRVDFVHGGCFYMDKVVIDWSHI